MWLYSTWFNLPFANYFDGKLNSLFQKNKTIKPITPTMAKVDCQPHWTAIHGTINGARIAPTLAPELNIPVANERSFLGNHSAVALIAQGKFPDSPNPNTNRANIKPAIYMGTVMLKDDSIAEIPPPICATKACSIALRDQMPSTQA